MSAPDGPPLRAVLFDMDGTVVDSEHLWAQAMTQIAAELGVSRIPVREDIIALDREGWVTVEPHRGAFVRGIDADYVRDHYELYGLVFGLMAARVAERADADGRARVLDAAKVVAAADATDARAFNDANRSFLRVLDEVAFAAPHVDGPGDDQHRAGQLLPRDPRGDRRPAQGHGGLRPHRLAAPPGLQPRGHL